MSPSLLFNVAHLDTLYHHSNLCLPKTRHCHSFIYCNVNDNTNDATCPTIIKYASVHGLLFCATLRDQADHPAAGGS